MVASSPALTSVREFLTQHGAGFMRNTIYIPGTTCPRCRGIPKAPYTSCYPCDFTYPGHASDRLAFLAYGIRGVQSGSVMRAYKADTPVPTAVQTVQMMLAYALVAHQPCLTDPTYGPPTSWATVPSLPVKGGVHQLHTLAAPVLVHTPNVTLSGVTPHKGSPRDFVPGNYTASGVTQHVLLIDDTWTTGGHIESAAAALKAAGAQFVTSLLVARWLEPTWGDTQSFINSHLNADYDPDTCPFTGQPC